MTILPGIRDKRLKTKWRGSILLFHGDKVQTIAYVYGKTLKEMRKRKKIVYRALKGGGLYYE